MGEAFTSGFCFPEYLPRFYVFASHGVCHNYHILIEGMILETLLLWISLVLRVVVLDADKIPIRLSAKYHFEKPNDKRALDLMNEAAAAVMNELPDLVLAYGLSDEYRYTPSPFLSLTQ
jgi:hypothetical protein